jgi:hypothetical protein
MSNDQILLIHEYLTRIMSLDTHTYPELNAIILGPCAELAKEALENLSNIINDL